MVPGQYAAVAKDSLCREMPTGRVLILTKPNSGKAEALNFGLQHLTDEEIFVGIDADTVIAREAIAPLVPHFLDPRLAPLRATPKSATA